MIVIDKILSMVEVFVWYLTETNFIIKIDKKFDVWYSTKRVQSHEKLKKIERLKLKCNIFICLYIYHFKILIYA